MNGLLLIELAIALGLVGIGILTVLSSNIVRTVIYLSVVSMLTAVAFVILKAPDVAITEIVIGSGLITFLFLYTLKASGKAGDAE